MTVRLQLFALVRQLAGEEVVEIARADRATVGDLRRALGEMCPDLAHLLPHVLFAVNSDYAGDEQAIPAGAEVACIPPVSGG
jgi:molybdopterin converting factor small subunit